MRKSDFEQLYMALYPGLYRLALSILRREADAQDAVQQAAVNAWAAADRMKPGGEKAYISRVVINECRNIQRHRLRIFPMEKPEDTPDPACPDSELKAVVDSLPETLRLPLLLRYMEGYSEKETAETLHISVAALKSRVFRARNQLKDMIIEESEKQ